jgi:hypothetical protein
LWGSWDIYAAEVLNEMIDKGAAEYPEYVFGRYHPAFVERLLPIYSM